MPACTLNKNEQCENFTRCRRYCGYKVGESLALMAMNMPTIETKIGSTMSGGGITDSNTYKYCGISIDKGSLCSGSYAHIGREVNTYKPFETPFKSFDGMTTSELIEKFLNIMFPNDKGHKALMNKYYSLVSGRLIPTMILPDEEITMKFKLEDKERQEIGRITAVSWKPDKETGEIRCHITSETKASGMNITATYEPNELFNRIYINKYRLGMKYTLKDEGIANMTKIGYISPIEIDDGKVILFLDGHNLIHRSNSGLETIIGSFNIKNEFIENTSSLELCKNSLSLRVAKQIIPFISKFRWFILPHGIADDHKIKAQDYVIDMRKIGKAKNEEIYR